MSNAYLTLRDRILAIVVDGRGADGALGPEATARSIPVGRFRRALDGAPLRDPSYPSSHFDRAVRLDWLGDADDAAGGINNPLDSPQHAEARVSLTHAVLYGTALSASLSLAGAEVAASSVLQAQERALNDALRIRRALAHPDLLRGGATLDPVPLACVREGGTSLDDLGEGRMLCVTVYTLRYQSDVTANYDP